VSIEDGVDGLEQLAASVRFVRGKLRQHWPVPPQAIRPSP
jgi:hypothetical protein